MVLPFTSYVTSGRFFALKFLFYKTGITIQKGFGENYVKWLGQSYIKWRTMIIITIIITFMILLIIMIILRDFRYYVGMFYTYDWLSMKPEAVIRRWFELEITWSPASDKILLTTSLYRPDSALSRCLLISEDAVSQVIPKTDNELYFIYPVFFWIYFPPRLMALISLWRMFKNISIPCWAAWSQSNRQEMNSINQVVFIQFLLGLRYYCKWWRCINDKR